MTDKPITPIYERVTEAHEKIQQDFSNIDPVVGVITKMRTIGIEADAMTIDCLKTGKRILLVFHDYQPDVVDYQFCMRDEDPGEEFESIPHQQVTAQQLYHWMKETFLIVN